MEKTIVELTKEYVVDPLLRIKLYDFVAEGTRNLILATDRDQFPVEGNSNQTEFADRLKKYENATSNLIEIFTLFGYWATNEHQAIVTLPIRRIGGQISNPTGNVQWLSLQWYPIYLLIYALGISSVASSNYRNLKSIFHLMVTSPRTREELPLLLVLVSEISNLDNGFKQLPDRERQFVPRSEYLYEFFKPIMDNILYINYEFEKLYDHFELLLALEHAHLRKKNGQGVWGPIGRFGWKHRSHNNPIAILEKEVEQTGKNWYPLTSGFFDGSLDRFKEVEKEFSESLNSLGWH